MNKTIFVIIILLSIAALSFAQPSGSLAVSNRSMFSSSDRMPFWLWANTDGKIEEHNSLLNFTELNAHGVTFLNDSNLFLMAGAELNLGLGDHDRYFRANNTYAGINWNNWELQAGTFYNDLYFDGLSTSNGNLAKSRNARPHPRIRFRVAEYKPVPLLKFLQFKGEYEEGILNDDRFVDKTRLHHKSLYLKAQPFTNFSIEAGLEHFVMWGGTSKDERYGKLPSDFDAYLKYIRAANGDENFPMTDRLNVAGNQYGTYQLLITQKFETWEASLNISHPFEDYSGVNLRNWPDKLIGLSVKTNDPDRLITHFLYEFTNTRQQGITDSLYIWIEDEQHWYRVHTDNYYSHGVYRSGVTYHKKMMASPLFFPVAEKEGISRGPESTRFYAHHIGAKGKLHKNIAWKGMLTYVKHFGNWGAPLDPPRKQVSAMIDLGYAFPEIPLKVGISLAADRSNTEPDRLGVQIKVCYLPVAMSR